MSQDKSSIVCRQCGEVIPLDAGACPHCGKGIIGVMWPVVGILFGLLIAVGSVLNSLIAFAVLGVVIAGSAAYLLYDRRRRIQRAAERGGHTSQGVEDEADSLY